MAHVSIDEFDECTLSERIRGAFAPETLASLTIAAVAIKFTPDLDVAAALASQNPPAFARVLRSFTHPRR